MDVISELAEQRDQAKWDREQAKTELAKLQITIVPSFSRWNWSVMLRLSTSVRLPKRFGKLQRVKDELNDQVFRLRQVIRQQTFYQADQARDGTHLMFPKQSMNRVKNRDPRQ
jgi:hypothetical protein